MVTEINVPEFWTALPWWGWALVGWYAAAGYGLRRWEYTDEWWARAQPITDGSEKLEPLFVWVISPVLGAAAGASVALWVLSCGLVQPAWRWGRA